MSNKLFGFILFTFIIMLFTFGGCKSDSTSSYGSTTPPPSGGGGTPNTIMMAGSVFSPSTLTIAKGTTITWNNNSSVTHTSTSNTSVWDTGDIAPGTSKTTTFNTSGSFPFHCKYHSMMTGTITVN
jgi:plastocyanin